MSALSKAQPVAPSTSSFTGEQSLNLCYARMSNKARPFWRVFGDRLGWNLLGWCASLNQHLPGPVLTRGTQFGLDAALAAVSLVMAFQLRFDGAVPPHWRVIMWGSLLVWPLLRPVSISIFDGYDAVWRYFNIHDALVLVLSSLPPTGLLLTVRFGYARDDRTMIPTGVILIELCVFLIFTVGARAFRRTAWEISSEKGARVRRALLVGSSDTLATALRQVRNLAGIDVVGLLTPDNKLRNQRIGGVTVLGDPEALPQLLVRLVADLVLIADVNLACIANCVEAATDLGAEVQLMPSAKDVLGGNTRMLAVPRPDLAVMERGRVLFRPHPAVTDAFTRQVVLVTGAGGSIGSEISRQVANLPISALVLFDHDENSIFEIYNQLTAAEKRPKIVPIVGDIRDRKQLGQTFQNHHPDIVLHAAAYKHVPIMEHNPCEAVLNNVSGTREVTDMAIAFGASRLVMISSDKAVRPSSIMGATKRMAELLVQSRAHMQARTCCACVRFGNVLGSRGSVVPIFLRQIATGGPVTITHEHMTRYFMTIPEAVRLVLQAATLASNGSLYMLDMGDPVKITNLARKLIEMSVLRPDKDIEIRFVGVRPGEKLHEQLWYEGTDISSTQFEGVVAVGGCGLPPNFELSLRLVEEAAASRQDGLVLQLLHEMPIEYRKHVPLPATRSGELNVEAATA